MAENNTNKEENTHQQDEEKKLSKQVLLRDLAVDVLSFATDQNGAPLVVFLNDKGETINDLGYPFSSNAADIDNFMRDLWAHYYDNDIISTHAVAEAMNDLRRRAKQSGRRVDLHTRTAEVDGSIWIDLGEGGSGFAHIYVTENGPRVDIVDSTAGAAIFQRTSGSAAMETTETLYRDGKSWREPRQIAGEDEPNPREGHRLVHLENLYRNQRPLILASHHFVNPSKSVKENWPLVVAWMVAALMPQTVKVLPAFVFKGSAGTGKTSAMRAIRDLIDPSTHDVTPFPSDTRSVTAARAHSFVVAFDNLGEKISEAQSDIFSGMITGQSVSERAYYTNSDMHTVPATRNPTMLTMINVAKGWKTDALQRMIVIDLDIGGASLSRLSEGEIAANFATWSPRMRQSLFNVIGAVMMELQVMAAEEHKIKTMPPAEREASGLKPQKPVTRFGAFERVLRAFDRIHGTAAESLFLSGISGNSVHVVGESHIARAIHYEMRERECWAVPGTSVLAEALNTSKWQAIIGGETERPLIKGRDIKAELAHTRQSLADVGLSISILDKPSKLDADKRQYCDKSAEASRTARWVVIEKNQEVYDEHKDGIR